VKYQRFEWLTIGVGGAAVFGSLGVTLLRGAPIHGYDVIVEMVAQGLLLVVLVGAVHWGRKGGFFAALASTVAYIGLRTPTIVAAVSNLEVAQLILVHTITYGIVGILGGEMCSRIKYFFARLENAFNIDEDSRVYNERFLGQVLAGQLAQHRRYGQLFSVGTLTLSPALTTELRPSKIVTLTRTVAAHMRDDVRLVDDVGRLSDGRFLFVYPHTSKEGAIVATERVRIGVRDVLGAKDESVTSTVLSVPEDLEEIQALLDDMQPSKSGDAPQEPSGS
jgi:GGDEF domain-containing protein